MTSTEGCTDCIRCNLQCKANLAGNAQMSKDCLASCRFHCGVAVHVQIIAEVLVVRWKL